MIRTEGTCSLLRVLRNTRAPYQSTGDFAARTFDSDVFDK